mmetsp:Transcript_17209/g.37444  ORF Transcript_17209/g.37444 Transcript_17209/m.37444 type:complete len:787 (+) Transcript_17209:120-2480(+)
MLAFAGSGGGGLAPGSERHERAHFCRGYREMSVQRNLRLPLTRSRRVGNRRSSADVAKSEAVRMCSESSPSAGAASTPSPAQRPIESSAQSAKSFDIPSPRDGRYPTPSPVAFTAKRQQVIQSFPSLPSMWPELAASFPDHVAVIDEHIGAEEGEKGVEMTFAQVHDLICRFGNGLAALGVRPQSNLALFSENSHRWLVADQALMRIGCASAVRGASAPPSELSYIYKNSDSVALIAENKRVILDMLRNFDRAASIRFCVVLFGDKPTREELAELHISASLYAKMHKFDDIVNLGEMYASNSPERCISAPLASLDDVATLIYTSGTTGNPKGVELTHRNLLHQTTYLSIGNVDTVAGDKFVSILPCWHIFERTAEYFVLARGGTLVYSNRRRFRDDLSRHKPNILVVVPRVLESLNSTIMSKVSQASKGKRTLFYAFLAISLAYVHAKRVLYGKDIHASRFNLVRRLWCLIKTILLLPLHALASAIIWRSVREALGGRVREIICGGGSLASSLEDFYEAADLNVFVGYGLTETSPVIANRFASRNVRGSAGLPPAGTEVKIVDADDRSKRVRRGQKGVLMVRGPQVTRGYYLNEAATEAAFDEEGFFDTGDLAYHAGTGGDVVIAGRMKDTIVLSNGENVEPAPVEDALLESPYIDQVMVVGQDRKALGALIVVTVDSLEANGFVTKEDAERIQGLVEVGDAGALKQVEPLLLDNGEQGRALKKEIDKEIATRSRERPNYTPNDRISSYRLLLRPFSVENGTLTQTLKIKRDAVSSMYAEEIEALF